MSVSFQIWYRGGQSEILTGSVVSQVLNQATAKGAVRAAGCGDVFRWIDGDWVYICPEGGSR